MTVGTVERIIDYAGDGSAVARAVPFYFLSADDLKVTRVNADASEVLLVRGVDYNVAGAGDPDGGSVTPTAPIVNGTSWVIEGNMPLEQPINYTSGDDFPAESHERGLDRGMIAAQEQARDIADTRTRALMVARGAVALPVGAVAVGEVVGRVGDELIGVPNDAATAAQLLADFEVVQGEIEATAAAIDEDADQVAADRGVVTDAVGTIAGSLLTAAGYVSAASLEADRAELAADGAFAGGTIYDDAAAGNAAVANGVNFIAVGATTTEMIDLWKRTGVGANTLLRSMYATTALTPAVRSAWNAAAAMLPAAFTSGYFWRKPAGSTIIKDVIGTAHADLSTWTGYGVDADGWVTLSGGTQAGKLPAQNHKAMIQIFELPEGGGTGYYFASSSGKAIGKGLGGPVATQTRVLGLQGNGLHKVFRRNDSGGSGAYEFEGGGVIGICNVTSTTDTGQPIIGAASGALAGKFSGGTMTLLATFCCATEPSDADVEAFCSWIRPFLTANRKWLRADDCPNQAIAVPIVGESTDEGTFFGSFSGTGSIGSDIVNVTGVSYGTIEAGQPCTIAGFAANSYVVEQLTQTGGDPPGQRGTYRISGTSSTNGGRSIYTSGIPVSQQNEYASRVMIAARNNAVAATLGIPVERLSARVLYANNVSPSVRAIAPKSGWERGFSQEANKAPDDGRQWHLLKMCQGSTHDAPGGTEAAQTTSTNYTNALGGTTTVTGALSRNAKNLVTSGMIGVLVNRNWHRYEQQARKRGIGYTVVIVVESGGLNSIFIGTGAVPDVATPQQWLEDKRSHWIEFMGIPNPCMIFNKPHQPDGNLDGIADNGLGGDPDYPNNAAGTDRQTANGYYRTATQNVADAHVGRVVALDDNDHRLNSPNDPVHHNDSGGNTKGAKIFQTAYAMRNIRASAA